MMTQPTFLQFRLTSNFLLSGPQTRNYGLRRWKLSSPAVVSLHYVVSCLTPQFAAEVRDLLLKPPTEQPYDQLKEQLTKRTTASEQRKLQLLFTSEELGDRKPTLLLRSCWVIDQG